MKQESAGETGIRRYRNRQVKRESAGEIGISRRNRNQQKKQQSAGETGIGRRNRISQEHVTATTQISRAPREPLTAAAEANRIQQKRESAGKAGVIGIASQQGVPKSA